MSILPKHGTGWASAENAAGFAGREIRDLQRVVIPPGLVDALRCQHQIDEDGTLCGVSRQAVDEAAQILSAPLYAAHFANEQLTLRAKGSAECEHQSALDHSSSDGVTCKASTALTDADAKAASAPIMSNFLLDIEIKPGRLYRAKKPSKSIYGGIVGDRRVVWINSNRTLVSFLNTAFPQSAPITQSMHRFLKWADHEVYEE